MISPFDDSEHKTAFELFVDLKDELRISIGGESYDMCEITDMFDKEQLRELVQLTAQGETTLINKAYIDMIAGLMK